QSMVKGQRSMVKGRWSIVEVNGLNARVTIAIFREKPNVDERHRPSTFDRRPSPIDHRPSTIDHHLSPFDHAPRLRLCLIGASARAQSYRSAGAAGQRSTAGAAARSRYLGLAGAIVAGRSSTAGSRARPESRTIETD